MIDPCELAPAYIRAIAPYQPGKPISELERELGISDIVKLASNENPLGPSPKAMAAARAALDEMAIYPDGNGFALKSRLAERLAVERDQIVLGNGSNDVLELAARAFLSPGVSAVHSRHAFAVYPLAIQATGGRGIEVAARDYGHDLDAMLAAIADDTRMLFVANPNNPTGTFVGEQALRSFLARVPSHVLVVLDEAYGEYLAPEQRMTSHVWIGQYPNLLVTRTFSKAFGLAGLRVGYAIGSRGVADLLNRVRQPFNVSSIALAAAEAALDDEAFIARSYEVNRAGMAQLQAGFRGLGLEWIPSAGNFIAFKVGPAAEVYQALLRAGVIVRPIGSYAMPEHLRVTIGTEAQNARFLGALERVLGGHR